MYIGISGNQEGAARAVRSWAGRGEVSFRVGCYAQWACEFLLPVLFLLLFFLCRLRSKGFLCLYLCLCLRAPFLPISYYRYRPTASHSYLLTHPTNSPLPTPGRLPLRKRPIRTLHPIPARIPIQAAPSDVRDQDIPPEHQLGRRDLSRYLEGPVVACFDYY